MPKPQSRRPIGRPPSRLTTPVIGWAERRRYKRFCAAPDAPPEPPPTPPPMRGTPESRTRTPQLSRARTRHNLAAPDWVLADDAALHRTSEFALLWQCSVCCAWTRDPVRHGYSRRCSVCRASTQEGRPSAMKLFKVVCGTSASRSGSGGWAPR